MTTPVEPGAALIEILERHSGTRMPTTGVGSVLVPNTLRINGVTVYADEVNPIDIGPIRFGGEGSGARVLVPITLFARVVRQGSTDLLPVEPTDAEQAATVELPEEITVPPPGQGGTIRLNGADLLLAEGGGPEILSFRLGTDVAHIRMTLLARRVVVDDEVIPPTAG